MEDLEVLNLVREVEKELDEEFGLNSAYELIGGYGMLFDAVDDSLNEISLAEQKKMRPRLKALRTITDSLSKDLPTAQDIKLERLCTLYTSLYLAHIKNKKASRERSRKASDGTHIQHREAKAKACAEWCENGAAYSSVKAFAHNNHKQFSVTPETLAGWIYAYKKQANQRCLLTQSV